MLLRPFCRVVRKVTRGDSPPEAVRKVFDSKQLIDKRLQAGMTQVQLAERLGVSSRSISNWETGATLPTPEFWATLATLLPLPAR